MKTKEPKPPKEPKVPTPRRPAQAVHRRLRAKLEALVAAPGTPDEGLAAQKKLERLLAKYEFLAADAEGIFAGKFERSTTAYPIADIADLGLIANVKWAIEESTKIPCLFAGSVLMAEATPRTADRLKTISSTIAEGFTALWAQFSTFPTVNNSDRGLFWRGLFDGMMNQPKPVGEPLPARIQTKATRRAKKLALGFASGIELHPYSVAVGLGRSIRFEVPLVEISQQLEQQKPKQIER